MNTKPKITLTKHSKQRFRQRMGIDSKSQMQELANKAFRYGDTNATCGNKKISKWLQNCTCGNKYKVRLLDGFAFTFRGGRLITVMSIPEDLRDDIQVES